MTKLGDIFQKFFKSELEEFKERDEAMKRKEEAESALHRKYYYKPTRRVTAKDVMEITIRLQTVYTEYLPKRDDPMWISISRWENLPDHLRELFVLETN